MADTVQEVVSQMLAATTPGEIEAARVAQREWVRAHPEDRLTVGMAGEQLTWLERLNRER